MKEAVLLAYKRYCLFFHSGKILMNLKAGYSIATGGIE